MNKATELKASKSSATPAKTDVSVIIPFYKAEELVAPLISSVLSCAEEIASIGAEIVMVNDSPDYVPLANELDTAARRLSESKIAYRLVINEVNLGFVGSVNAQMKRALESQNDVILLNSDTVVFPGVFIEMIAVSQTDNMIGFVSPRSNNATICSLPADEAFQDVTPAEGYMAFQAISKHLARKTYVPTVVGFCMLIKHSILAEFGVFDTAYGAGYNEENDLVCRAGMVGYRAVLANHAFVWHCGEQSFSISGVSKNEREIVNRKILLDRYPHYAALVDAYFASPKFQTEQILSGLVPDSNGALKIAFDFSTFGAHHNGTFEAGIRLLESSMSTWGEGYSFWTICSEEAFEFHNLSRFGSLSRSPVHSNERFAAILRIGQPFDQEILKRLFNRAPVVLISMLDTISQDCGPLYNAEIDDIWAFVGQYADIIASISDYSMNQFAARYDIAPTAIKCPSLLSVDVADYQASSFDQTFLKDAKDSILLMGNHYPHKAIKPTLEKLLERMPEGKFVTIGIEHHDSRVLSYGAGHMTDAQVAALYRACKAVVFPSYYEGFGLPILHALANEKPVYAREMPVFNEIKARLGRTANVQLFDTTDTMVDAVARGQHNWKKLRSSRNEGWARSATDLRLSVESAFENVRSEKIEQRIRALNGSANVRQWESHSRIPQEAGSHKRNAAKFIGIQSERIAQKLFENRFIYRGSQMLFRALRRVRG